MDLPGIHLQHPGIIRLNNLNDKWTGDDISNGGAITPPLNETVCRVPVFAVAAIYSNLKPSARDLVGDVHKYMEEVLWKLTEDVACAFPCLKAAIKALVSSCLCDWAFTWP